MQITDFHAKYYANILYHAAHGNTLEALTGTLSDAQVDLNPHQVEAALFAIRSPFSKGVIMGEYGVRVEHGAPWRLNSFGGEVEHLRREG